MPHGRNHRRIICTVANSGGETLLLISKQDGAPPDFFCDFFVVEPTALGFEWDLKARGRYGFDRVRELL